MTFSIDNNYIADLLEAELKMNKNLWLIKVSRIAITS